MGLNEIVKALFDGYKDAKAETYYDRKFEEMAVTNRLFEVDEVNDMLKHAETKEHYDIILDHLYRFDAVEQGQYGYFKKIETNIIHQLWGE